MSHTCCDSLLCILGVQMYTFIVIYLTFIQLLWFHYYFVLVKDEETVIFRCCTRICTHKWLGRVKINVHNISHSSYKSITWIHYSLFMWFIYIFHKYVLKWSKNLHYWNPWPGPNFSVFFIHSLGSVAYVRNTFQIPPNFTAHLAVPQGTLVGNHWLTEYIEALTANK